MKIQSAIKETKNRFGVITKAGGLTLALVAAPIAGAAAYGANAALDPNGDLCVVASLTNSPDFFAARGSCPESDLPNSGSNPEASNPNPSTPPVETTPPVTVERASITDVQLYANGTRELTLLNNGGFLEVVADKQIFLTPSRGATAKEIVGYPASWVTNGMRLDANASPDGKTIVVYNYRYASVSFDGGTTWTTQQQAMWYDAEHQYLTSDVSADGKVVILSQGKIGGSGFLTWLNSDSSRQAADWKSTSIYDQYSLDISGDGSTVFTSLYLSTFPKQSRIDLNVTPYAKVTDVNLYGYGNYRGFAASSDLQKQLKAMRDGSDNTNYLFTSKDGGVTMTKKMVGQFTTVGISTDGVIQAATRINAGTPGQLYMSFDSGENWKTMDVLNGASLLGAQLSPDGKMLRIVTSDSKTYFATVNP
jgi:hypothetical protein